MKTDEIKETIEYFRERGITVRVRDIAYAMLSKVFEPQTAFQCLFGSDGFDMYADAKERALIEDFLKTRGHIKSGQENMSEGISFEENKREMESLIQRIEAGIADGTIEPIQGFNQIKDIRTKLNDKFQMEKKNIDRVINVNRKFDFVCPTTRRECYQLNKEDAMRLFNLIEKPE